MGAIRLQTFVGMIPLRDARLLPDNAATVAENLRLETGALRGLQTPRKIKDVTPGTRRVFRIPDGFPTSNLANSYFMEFADPDTDVVKAPVVNDSFERYYWASPTSGPRYNTAARIKAGNSGGNAPYKLGVPRPTGTPTLTATGGTTTLTKVTRSYVYTYEDDYGQEGQPSLPVEFSHYPDGTWTLGAIVDPTTNAEMVDRRPITKINIYRTITAETGATTFFKVHTLTPWAATYADTKSDSLVSGQGQLESTTWAIPPQNLQGMALMPNGIVVGWFENTLYFSENWRPHAWPAEYALQLEHRVVGLGVFGNTCVVCTEGHPVTVSGVKSYGLALNKSDTPMPCVSRGSIVSTVAGVIYATENGLVLFGPGGIQELTKNLLTREMWVKEYQPTKIRAIYLDGCYTAVRRTVSNTDDGFFFSPTALGEGMVKLSDFGAAADITVDAITGKGLVVIGSELFEWLPADLSTNAKLKYRTKEFHIQRPCNFGFAQVFWEPPVTPLGNGQEEVRFRVYAGGQLVFNQDLTGRNGQEFRLPSGFKTDLWQFEVEGYAAVKSIHVASTSAELKGV
jgi:hypothetical protein